jgi:hypothetical protein
MARENRSWGYDRIVGALANLGHDVCDQTVGNVLRRHGLSPAPQRKHTTTWAEFIRAHLAVLAGADFFTAEVLTRRGLVTYYVLFFIHLESRKVDIAGITVYPKRSFSWVSALCGGRWASMSSTTMPSGTIKGSRTTCCSVRLWQIVGTSPCTVARGWVGSCAITIKKPRNFAGSHWPMVVRLRQGR